MPASGFKKETSYRSHAFGRLADDIFVQLRILISRDYDSLYQVALMLVIFH